VLSEWELLGRVAVAMVLGAAIGFERLLADKPAGMRTHMLVAGAAAVVVVTGAEVLAESDGGGDPTRALHAVVTGVGFLGAGTILQLKEEGRVEGLTTATSIFFTATVGVAAGLGYPILASGAAAMALTTLWGVRKLEKWASRRGVLDI
jgi:putative Mg2+ transporter-C (MgtC) family protein